MTTPAPEPQLPPSVYPILEQAMADGQRLTIRTRSGWQGSGTISDLTEEALRLHAPALRGGPDPYEIPVDLVVVLDAIEWLRFD